MSSRYVLKLSPPILFLADSLGALLSAVLLALVLAPLENVFGMPAPVLYGLSAAALVFAVYSGACYLWSGPHSRTCLRIIAIANILYAGATVGLVLYFYQRLTIRDLLYFCAELTVITLLVAAEWRLLKRLPV